MPHALQLQRQAGALHPDRLLQQQGEFLAHGDGWRLPAAPAQSRQQNDEQAS
ncbi:MAG: hypothetical protein K1X65_20250 [Caldilineales bacterium]|nr:hypothetical protein [Caldilineales bacterium]